MVARLAYSGCAVQVSVEVGVRGQAACVSVVVYEDGCGCGGAVGVGTSVVGGVVGGGCGEDVVVVGAADGEIVDGGGASGGLDGEDGDGLAVSAPILLITGAGGAFGAILKETPVSDYLGHTLSSSGIGIFMPFIVAAALKTAQGSTTVALVTASSIVAPLLGQMGLDSETGRVLCLMAIGAGAMTVSHANDSFFWVVTQFSRMSVGQGYRTQTAATAIQGISGILWIWLLAWVML